MKQTSPKYSFPHVTWKTFIVTFLVIFVQGVSYQVAAEDIEIYESLTGTTLASAPTELKPNILFVLDTSGSMAFPEVEISPRPKFDSSEDYGDLGKIIMSISTIQRMLIQGCTLIKVITIAQRQPNFMTTLLIRSFQSIEIRF